MKIKKNKLLLSKWQLQLIMFIIIGGLSTIIDFIVYIFLLNILSINYSKAISMVNSSLFSYFMNKKFTFNKKKETNIKFLIKFYIVFLLNFITNLVVNFYIYKYTSEKLLAFILATLAGMSINFLGQKFFVFK